MGVQVETIAAGDGKNEPISVAPCLVRAVAVYSHAFAHVSSPGQTFPKKGQRVVVHYVGE